MSYAEIVGGGADGRYTIKLDWGEARKAQLLAQVAAAQAKLTQQLAQQQQHVDAAKAGEAQSLANLQAFQDALIAGMGPVQGAGPSDSAKRLYDEMLERHRQLVLSHQPARDALAKLKVQVAQANAMAAYWNNFVATETRPAWCCDRTENASGYVATVDIPGENNLILIAPGGRGWQPSDGVLTAREIMSPEQAFFNAAILPGWQKHTPTYRWGTASNIDRDANTMTVTLGDATSSAQRLSVNEKSTLHGVPITYMSCHHEAFEEGDRVVVQFEQRDWESPRVIGFVDNPRQCRAWPQRIYMRLTFESVIGTSPGSRYWGVEVDGNCGRFLAFGSQHAIAGTADHVLRLDPPFFPDSSDSVGYEIETEGGRFTTLWTGHSAAFGFGTGTNPTYRVPSGSGCNSFYAMEQGATGTDIKIIEDRVTAFTTSKTWPVYRYDCSIDGAVSGGAWLDPIDMTRTEIVSGHVVAWLESVNAMPSIRVRRKNSTATKRYEFVSRSELLLVGTPGVTASAIRWELAFREAP